MTEIHIFLFSFFPPNWSDKEWQLCTTEGPTPVFKRFGGKGRAIDGRNIYFLFSYFFSQVFPKSSVFLWNSKQEWLWTVFKAAERNYTCIFGLQPVSNASRMVKPSSHVASSHVTCPTSSFLPSKIGKFVNIRTLELNNFKNIISACLLTLILVTSMSDNRYLAIWIL